MGICTGRAVMLSILFVVWGSTPILAYDISGRVQIELPYPAAKMIKVQKKIQDSCADEQISKALLVSPEGGLVNAVLRLEGTYGKSNKSSPSTYAVLDQKNCNFEPHVVLISPGSSLKILNSDPLAHDVRAFEQASMLFRLDMDPNAKPEERSFEKSGIYTIRCGFHPWMHAFVVQTEHDFYAVSNEHGEFVLQDVPAGEHILRIWHETLGEVEIPIEVSESIKDFSYTFKNPSSSSI